MKDNTSRNSSKEMCRDVCSRMVMGAFVCENSCKSPDAH